MILRFWFAQRSCEFHTFKWWLAFYEKRFSKNFKSFKILKITIDGIEQVSRLTQFAVMFEGHLTSKPRQIWSRPRKVCKLTKLLIIQYTQRTQILELSQRTLMFKKYLKLLDKFVMVVLPEQTVQKFSRTGPEFSSTGSYTRIKIANLKFSII